ncbi:MAG: 2-oxoglutarate and iron-dependent oxygenase domain-containing protein [Alsobacter sp.]
MIPIIDVTGLESGSPGALQRVAREIGEAARGIGFFALTGHGVAADDQAAIFAQARRLFALPVAAKEALSIERAGNNRGWVRLGGEALDPTRPADLKEAFNVGLELAPQDREIVEGRPFRGLNAWPDLPGFREAVLGYYDRAWALGMHLHRAIATDLGEAEDFFAAKFDRPLATLRLLRYPPAPGQAPAGALGAGEHTDYGNLTLLLTDDAGGLEVRTRDGQWIAPPASPGAYVVNIGDCLMRWTNDVYVSTPHRVVHRAPRERLSIAFFLDPNPDAVVEALPGCVSAGRPARYPPISGADYLAERLDATYAHRRKG